MPSTHWPPLSLLFTLTSPCTATFLGLVYANTRLTTKQPPNPCLQPLLLSLIRQQATPAVHYGFFPGTQLALLSVLAQPLLPNPWQLFQIVSTFLRAATASHPPHSCSVDDSHLCSWAWLSKHSSHSNPSAHLSRVPS